MGAVSRDIYKKARQYEEIYPYEADGIKALLRDIHRLSESRYLDGDIDATTIIVDLKSALDSDCLTPRMRQVIALYYFAQMTEEEIAEILNVNRRTVNYAIESALERISTFMEYGYSRATNARIDAHIEPSHPFLKWVNDVADGIEPVYSVSEYLTDWLALKGDRKAQETLRQRTEGYRYEPIYENDEQKYPALTWEQLKWRDRRMSYVPEVYPQKDVLGFRKVAVKLDDGDRHSEDWRYERRKIFI